MSKQRPKFSICIPAYNRAKFLPELLDSIYSQNFLNYEIVVCEDFSRERNEIYNIISKYNEKYPESIKYFENEVNLGYDGNIRNLISKATGEYCFFMGNDDVMCDGVLLHISQLLNRHKNVGFVLKSYDWFDVVPDKPNQAIRYFDNEEFFNAGVEAITICFRRSGVISGYIVERDAANSCATNQFDGTLFYQMHITASVLADHNAVFTPMILVHCRNGEPPEFGNSAAEKGKYIPGSYTPEARISMIAGVLQISRNLKIIKNIDIFDVVLKDYSNYFYPYIRDQLNLPILSYIKLCVGYANLGFGRYPMFYIYCTICYIFGTKRFDAITGYIRKKLGRTIQLGI